MVLIIAGFTATAATAAAVSAAPVSGAAAAAPAVLLFPQQGQDNPGCNGQQYKDNDDISHSLVVSQLRITC